MCSIAVSDRGRAGSGIAPARLRRFPNKYAVISGYSLLIAIVAILI